MSLAAQGGKVPSSSMGSSASGGQTARKDRPGRPRGRVLVVEDEDLLRDAIVPLLEEQGHEVAFVENGREALAWLHTRPAPDVIVLDLRMPVMNGWEFRAIQKDDPRLKGIPVVALSADDSAQAAAISAEAYLRKPVDPEKLVKTIAGILAARARESSCPSDELQRFTYLKRLVAGVGHEINNPLTVVMLNLNQSIDDITPTIRGLEQPLDGQACSAAQESVQRRLTGVAQMLEECRIGAERIREGVENLQQLSHLGEGPAAALDLHRVIEESMTEAWSQILNRAALVKSFGDPRPIVGDERALRQVFRNILITVARSVPEQFPDRSEIKIETAAVAEEKAEELMIAIRESGNQKAPHAGVQVFKPGLAAWPFGEETARTLAISHEIVGRHRGRMTVESVLGTGRVFRVFLPVAEGIDLPPPAVEPTRPRAALMGKQVLVVEDEVEIARHVQRALRDEHHVTVVPRASDAIALLDEPVRFDLILCDLEMPGITGAAFHAVVRERWPHVLKRLVFMTGGACSKETSAFVEAAAHRILDKPFTVKRLRQFVEESLRGELPTDS